MNWLVLLAALLADRRLGEPDVIWSRLPHPVVLFGKAVGFADKHLNRETDSDGLRYRKGSAAVVVLILLAVAAGLALEWLFDPFGWIGHLAEAFVVFVLLAQKSLIDHVAAVAHGLRTDGIEGGRKAVSMIVGRDPSVLNRAGVSRATIETLGENFSDGVVAPAFWYLVFGLPGIVAYKMVNTADSMIGYHTERHEWFGKTAAQVDDLANWVPARLSALLVAAGAFFARGSASAAAALRTAFRDSSLHRSPNAGWPEAALAGACGFALGGPRTYPGETVAQAHINASGRHELDATDIDAAIRVVASACSAFSGTVLIGAVLWLI